MKIAHMVRIIGHYRSKFKLKVQLRDIITVYTIKIKLERALRLRKTRPPTRNRDNKMDSC